MGTRIGIVTLDADWKLKKKLKDIFIPSLMKDRAAFERKTNVKFDAFETISSRLQSDNI